MLRHHLSGLPPKLEPWPTTDPLRLLAQEALRGVVRQVLTDAAKNGLPGDHHFYITFDTRRPAFGFPPRMREKYPEEMTIVLQHQFWDLKVGEHGFEVGLSFNGVPESLLVPFEAIKGFFDPSVQFGLQFETSAEAAAPQTPTTATPRRKPRLPSTSDSTRRGSSPSSPAAAAPAPSDSRSGDNTGGQASAGEVVRLDRFRKKYGTRERAKRFVLLPPPTTRWPRPAPRPTVSARSRFQPTATGAHRPSARCTTSASVTEPMPRPVIRALGVGEARRGRGQSRAWPARCQRARAIVAAPRR